MRPSATGPPEAAAQERAATAADREAWSLAQARAQAEAHARERLAREAGPPGLGAAGEGGGPVALPGEPPGAGPGCQAPALAPEGAAAAGGAERAQAVLALQRRGEVPVLEVGCGPGLRYALAAGPGGVEIEARAAPALLPVARADLHAVAGELRRRGVPVARATVSTSPAGAEVRGRVDLPARGR